LFPFTLSDESQTPDQTTSQDQSQSDDSSDEDDDEMAFPDTQVAQSANEKTYDKYNLDSLGGEDSDNDPDSGSQQGTGTVGNMTKLLPTKHFGYSSIEIIAQVIHYCQTKTNVEKRQSLR
jgi:hypothetical protein